MRFAGQTIVVTGGASGIGQEICRRLAAEGGRIAIWDADGDSAQRTAAELGNGARAFPLDVADADAVTAVATETIAALGTPHALIASAGITGPNAPTWEYPVEAWRRVFAVNVDGIFLCCRALAPAMRAAGYGRIVALASVAGKEGNPNASAYSASKAAVIGLTKSLGKELATSGVTVNCVTPAAVRTPIFEQMTEAHIAFMLSKIPMGRFGTTGEIAALVCWLASREASFSTGAVFDCSGGRATY